MNSARFVAHGLRALDVPILIAALWGFDLRAAQQVVTLALGSDLRLARRDGLRFAVTVPEAADTIAARPSACTSASPIIPQSWRARRRPARRLRTNSWRRSTLAISGRSTLNISDAGVKHRPPASVFMGYAKRGNGWPHCSPQRRRGDQLTMYCEQYLRETRR